MKESILYNIYQSGKYLSLLLFFLIACDDLEDKPSLVPGESGDVYETGTAEMYILSEGLFNQNNSSLARYSFNQQKRTSNYFSANNQRGLGDTANDMAIYGNKIYIVVNVSSTVEVIDFTTGKSIRQIQMLRDNGSSRQPRSIAFDKDKAYVCSFDGTVARIDTTSLEIEAIITAGRNPDDICVQNNKLYVSNSGSLDYSGPGVDNTVSVIDITTFKETKKIEVGPNPGKILPGLEDAVYVTNSDLNTPEGRVYKHQIAYTPRVSASGHAGIETPWVNLSYSFLFSGKRYMLGQNISDNRLDSYSDHSLSAGRDFKMRNVTASLNVEVLNLLNKNYEIVKNFPMPGRSFRVTVGVRY